MSEESARAVHIHRTDTPKNRDLSQVHEARRRESLIAIGYANRPGDDNVKRFMKLKADDIVVVLVDDQLDLCVVQKPDVPAPKGETQAHKVRYVLREPIPIKVSSKSYVLRGTHFIRSNGSSRKDQEQQTHWLVCAALATHLHLHPEVAIPEFNGEKLEALKRRLTDFELKRRPRERLVWPLLVSLLRQGASEPKQNWEARFDKAKIEAKAITGLDVSTIKDAFAIHFGFGSRSQKKVTEWLSGPELEGVTNNAQFMDTLRARVKDTLRAFPPKEGREMMAALEMIALVSNYLNIALPSFVSGPDDAGDVVNAAGGRRSGEVACSVAELLIQFRNIILEGVPGTGKTFALKGIAKVLRAKWGESEGRSGEVPGTAFFDSITFHPATAYEDFVEGIRPVQGGGEQRKLEVVLDQEDPLDLKLERSGEEIPLSTGPEAEPEWFFQSRTPAEEGWGVRDGFFLRVCTDALLQPERAFIVLLDELNRANVPKVMGDLLTTLERSKRARWKEDHWDLDDATDVQLPVSGRHFFVPENVFVVGTMNTSDRSVTPLDAALRRRFAFYRLEPLDKGKLKEALRSDGVKKMEKFGVGQAVDLGSTRWTASLEAYKQIQAWLWEHLGADGMLGHSYFFDLLRDQYAAGAKAEDEEDLHRHTWQYVILPQVVAAIESAGKESEDLSELNKQLGQVGFQVDRQATQSFLGGFVIRESGIGS